MIDYEENEKKIVTVIKAVKEANKESQIKSFAMKENVINNQKLFYRNDDYETFYTEKNLIN